MKKNTLFLVIFIYANCQLPIINCTAQPNGGFENWTSGSAYEDPVGWQTLNFLSLFNPPNPLTVFKVIGQDKHSGNYALKLKTEFANNNPFPGVVGDTAGAVFTGKINVSPFSYTYGFPYTGRPEKIEFWSKYIPIGNDTGFVFVILRKWDGVKHDTISYSRIIIPSTTDYTLFQLPLIYSSLELPDSAAIVFGSSKDSTTARVGSLLFIDDVAFTGWVGVDQQKAIDEKVLVFPNPAKDNLMITTEMEEAESATIIDISGKEVAFCKIQNKKANINTSLFSQGMYFYEIRDKKNKILAKDKFSVLK